MKKLLKKIIPVTVLAVLCACAITLGACSKDVVLKGDAVAMEGACAELTLTLKEGGSAVFDLNLPGLSETNQWQTNLDTTGTWTLEDNVYTVNLTFTIGAMEIPQTYTSTYDESTKKHTIHFRLAGPEMVLDTDLVQQ